MTGREGSFRSGSMKVDLWISPSQSFAFPTFPNCAYNSGSNEPAHRCQPHNGCRRRSDRVPRASLNLSLMFSIKFAPDRPTLERAARGAYPVILASSRCENVREGGEEKGKGGDATSLARASERTREDRRGSFTAWHLRVTELMPKSFLASNKFEYTIK